MADLKFEWDSKKARANLKKHGVAFAEAETVFLDEHALEIADPDDAGDEERFVIIGASASNSVLVVCHCYRERKSVIRLISARVATKREKASYNERWTS